MHKVYTTGQEFLDDNLSLIRSDPLGTTFFESNARSIQRCDESNYAIRVEKDGALLLAIRLNGFPLVIYGSVCCAAELAKIVADNKLQFGKVIGCYDLLNAFLTSYEGLVGGSHKVSRSMDVMYCDKVNSCDTSGVQQATELDTEELAQLVVDFTVEAINDKPEWSNVVDKVSRAIGNYALVRVDGEIVSIGYYYVDGQLRRISNVYTKPKYRNRGYSRKVVTYLTEQVLQSGSLPCLYVDQYNPVSNHLYRKIGYVYGESRYEVTYIK